MLRAYSQFLISKNKKPGACTRPANLKLGAGARYVPNRQFLSIPFRSELVHYTVSAAHCDEDSGIVSVWPIIRELVAINALTRTCPFRKPSISAVAGH